MARLVTGRFSDVEQVERALAALQAAGFERHQYGVFYVTPPGQHDKFPIGGDALKDAGTADSAPGAVTGAALGGGAGVALGAAAVVAFPVAGLAALFAGAGLGAYVGSLVGAMSRTKHVPTSESTVEAPAEPLGGVRIAVNVDGADEASATHALEAAGATDLAPAEGEFRQGEWKDYDPRTPPA
jgi:hypothetical protein